MTNKKISMTLIMTIALFIAPVASGNLGGLMQPSFAEHEISPTCTSGEYNPDTDQCEETVASEVTCDIGTLNTETDLCEEKTTTGEPFCTNGVPNGLGQCEERQCIREDQNGRCSEYADVVIGSVNCSTGEYDIETNQCVEKETLDPTCTSGAYNRATNQCEETVASEAICEIGELNTETDLCEISPDQFLIEKIEQLVDEDVINQGEGTSLIVKIQNAIEDLSRQNNNAACGILDAFINEVEAMISSDRLTSEQGNELIDGSIAIRNSIPC